MKKPPSLLVFAAGLLLANAALAGSRELADGTFDHVGDSNYSSDGQFWHSPQSFSSTGNLNIPINLGSGAVSGRPFTFNQSTGVLNVGSGALVISPLTVPDGYNTLYGSDSFWNFGELAPAYVQTNTPTGPFNYASPTPLGAYRFNWVNLCPNDAGVCSFSDLLTFQAVIIAIDPDDFMVMFNYQNSAAPPAHSFGTLQIGTTTIRITGELIDTGPNLCFHDGGQVACATDVPEPSTNVLIVLGLAALSFAAYRKTRLRTQRV